MLSAWPVIAWLVLAPAAASDELIRLSCESTLADRAAAVPGEVLVRGFCSGELAGAGASTNLGCWHFDGTRTIVRWPIDPRRTTGAFTWEGFFLTSRDNLVETDPAISDRFLTQFADAQSQQSRLTIGLSVAAAWTRPRLSIALTGHSRRLGSIDVTVDVWHHFAVVHRPATSAQSPATIAWYLDHEPCGELVLDSQSPASTLLPPGTAPLAIGGRNLTAGKVDRGFNGFLDELRITTRALEPSEFLRVRPEPIQRNTTVEVLGNTPEKFSWESPPTATEVFRQEALSIAGLPPAFSFSGVPAERQGRHLVRARRQVTLPAGRYTVLLRTACPTLLSIDGKPLVDARDARAVAPDKTRLARAQEIEIELKSDGQPHGFSLLAALDQGTRATFLQADTQPAAGAAAQQATIQGPAGDEVIVLVGRRNEAGRVEAWQMLGTDTSQPIAPYWWLGYRGRMQQAWQADEPERREAIVRRRDDFWQRRHTWAREVAEQWPVAVLPADAHPIDFLLNEKLRRLGIEPAPRVDDATFLRRVTLDLAGRNPTLDEAQKFLGERAAGKRERLVDRLLAKSEWADAWMGYWQDLLAENPSILKATLNNSGPFRFWLYDSLAANKPLDQFAAELLLMEGRDSSGGTAGFAVATGNELPMAMKAHVVAKAFLGVDMKCARCHDSPAGPFEQADLFGLAAMLGEQSFVVPKESTVVASGGRKPAVSSALKAGDRVEPHWPLEELIPENAAGTGVLLTEYLDRPRAQLASLVISPRSTRFSDVLVNRIWQRYFGVGLIEPVDHWLARDEASHPELLAWLSRELVQSGYNLKHLVRLIVTSDAYQREVRSNSADGKSARTFAAQQQRRLSAEQLVDSIYALAGKTFDAEELNFDPAGTQDFLTLPAPERAWQCASLSNERDRPALALPVNQMLVDLLAAFGWRETRPDPVTRAEVEANPLQPLLLANGQAVNHALRLTEKSAITAWCLAAKTPAELAEQLVVAAYGRRPDAEEQALLVELLRPGFDQRATGQTPADEPNRPRTHVDWEKHLEASATQESLEAARLVRIGDPPTVRLTDDFRQRVEDIVWALVNSPEFVFIP